MQLNPMNFIPIAGVTPLDGNAFMTPQEKYIAMGGGKTVPEAVMGGGQQPPAAGGVPGQGGGAAPTSGAPGGGGGGLMESIMKLFMSGGIPM